MPSEPISMPTTKQDILNVIHALEAAVGTLHILADPGMDGCQGSCENIAEDALRQIKLIMEGS